MTKTKLHYDLQFSKKIPKISVELNTCIQQAMSDIADQFNKDLYYQSPEELAALEEFNRTYVPPVRTPEQQMITDFYNDELDYDTLTNEELKMLLKEAKHHIYDLDDECQ